MKKPNEDFLPIKTEGDWTLCVKAIVYRRRKCSSGYFRNKITHENCGQVIKLYRYLYDENGKAIPKEEQKLDEDVYEWVHEDGTVSELYTRTED